MKGLIIAGLLVVLGVCLVICPSCPKKVYVKPPDAQIEVGPTHKRLEFSNRNGKKLFNIDVFEDGKNVNVKPQGEAEIKVK